MGKISPASKLLAKTQPGFANAVRDNSPHELMKTLASSHETSSATKSLAVLTHLLTIRQNPTVQSHPNLVDQINNAFQQVITCWESQTKPGFIAIEDLRGAAYLNSLRPATYAAPKERFLAANPIRFARHQRAPPPANIPSIYNCLGSRPSRHFNCSPSAKRASILPTML